MIEIHETPGGERVEMPQPPERYRLIPLKRNSGIAVLFGGSLEFEASDQAPQVIDKLAPGEYVAIWGRSWGPRIGMVCEPMTGRHADSMIVLQGFTPEGRLVAFYYSALRRIDRLVR